jgi:hypothetical protein
MANIPGIDLTPPPTPTEAPDPQMTTVVFERGATCGTPGYSVFAKFMGEDEEGRYIDREDMVARRRWNDLHATVDEEGNETEPAFPVAWAMRTLWLYGVPSAPPEGHPARGAFLAAQAVIEGAIEGDLQSLTNAEIGILLIDYAVPG